MVQNYVHTEESPDIGGRANTLSNTDDWALVAGRTLEHRGKSSETQQKQGMTYQWWDICEPMMRYL